MGKKKEFVWLFWADTTPLVPEVVIRPGVWHGSGPASGCSEDAHLDGHICFTAQGQPRTARQTPILTGTSGAWPKAKPNCRNCTPKMTYPFLEVFLQGVQSDCSVTHKEEGQSDSGMLSPMQLADLPVEGRNRLHGALEAALLEQSVSYHSRIAASICRLIPPSVYFMREWADFN